MDYAEQVKNVQLVERFTFADYRKLKRKIIHLVKGHSTQPRIGSPL
jgi:hypothetical protein